MYPRICVTDMPPIHKDFSGGSMLTTRLGAQFVQRVLGSPLPAQHARSLLNRATESPIPEADSITLALLPSSHTFPFLLTTPITR